MKLNTKSLREALNACQAAIRGVRAPELQWVKLAARDGVLSLGSTNHDIWIIRTVECEGELAPTATSLKVLLQAVEFEKAESIDLSLDGNALCVTGLAKSHLATMDITLCPAWPVDNVTPYGVNCADLADGIEAVQWSTAHPDQKRENLENVAVILSPHAIECVASDGRMISHFLRPAITGEGSFQIPHSFIDPFIIALRCKESELAVGDNCAIVQHANGVTRVKLSTYEFPPAWRDMLATKTDELPWLELPTEELKSACAMACAYNSVANAPALFIDWLPEGIVQLSVRGDTGNSYSRDIENPDAVAGEAIATTNARYLTGAMSRMDGPTLKFTPTERASFWERGDLCVMIMNLDREKVGKAEPKKTK